MDCSFPQIKKILHISNNLRLTGCCKNSTKDSHIHFTQLPQLYYVHNYTTLSKPVFLRFLSKYLKYLGLFFVNCRRLGFTPVVQQNSGKSVHPLLQTQTWNSDGGCHSSYLCPHHHRGRPVTKPGQSQYFPTLGLSLSDYTRDWKRIHARKIHGPPQWGSFHAW